MRAIFISYRRQDSEGQAGRLFDDFARHFGEDSVFMDVAGIEAGRDFRRVIDENVATCGVLLAIIGKSWIDAKDESGRRRLDDPMDFVRLETASALKRDIPVVPVLVHGARMPRAEQLPPDLEALAYRNGVELTHARWDSDVQVLIKALSRYVSPQQQGADRANTGSSAKEPGKKASAGIVRPSGMPETVDIGPGGTPQPSKKSWGMIIAGSVVAMVIAVGGYTLYQKSQTAERIRQESLLEEKKKQAAAEEFEAKKRAEAAAATAELEKKQAREKADTDRREAERQAKLAADRQAQLDADRQARLAREQQAQLDADRQKAKLPPRSVRFQREAILIEGGRGEDLDLAKGEGIVVDNISRPDIGFSGGYIEPLNGALMAI